MSGICVVDHVVRYSHAGAPFLAMAAHSAAASALAACNLLRRALVMLFGSYQDVAVCIRLARRAEAVSDVMVLCCASPARQLG